ncbi:hypothetical protein RJ639_016197 [Escallonia herrerae]|uniref:RING-type domain-containing protein n=1 Tax=Escallonia herrerae TaxID=1293975 RepID=A0AA88VDG2_9ASTE|nr:hypothetical protein RJ639_016197 [Escallonia herrerae]
MEGSGELREEAVGANSLSFVCQICMEHMLLSSQFKNPNRCAHPFCTECMIKHIQAKLEDNVASIKCPALDCEQFLDPPSCRPVMPTQLFVKWCDVLVDTALLGTL